MTDAPYENESELRAKLELGWTWMKANRLHPGRHKFFDRWLIVLGQYTALFGAIELKDPVELPPPSPWIPELAEQLGFEGAPDFDPVAQEKPGKLKGKSRYAASDYRQRG